jgi:hypothetical protein
MRPTILPKVAHRAFDNTAVRFGALSHNRCWVIRTPTGEAFVNLRHFAAAFAWIRTRRWTPLALLLRTRTGFEGGEASASASSGASERVPILGWRARKLS